MSESAISRPAGRGILKLLNHSRAVNGNQLGIAANNVQTGQPDQVNDNSGVPAKPAGALKHSLLAALLKSAQANTARSVLAQSERQLNTAQIEPQSVSQSVECMPLPNQAGITSIAQRPRGRGIRPLSCVNAEPGRTPGSQAAAGLPIEKAHHPDEAAEQGLKKIAITSEETSPQAEKPLSFARVPPSERVVTTGQKLDLCVNYIKLKILEGRGIYEYEVTFDPPIDSRQMRFQLMKPHADVFGAGRNFDGVTLYLPHLLPQKVTMLSSPSPVDETPVQIKITYRREQSMKDCIHFYNTLFQRIMRTLEMVQSRNNYYNPKASIRIDRHKLEVWPGYITAVHEYDGGLLLCADVSFRVLRTETVHDVLRSILDNNRQNFLDEAKKKLIGLTVITKYNNRTWRIDEICVNLTPMSEYSCQGKPTTYMDYFKNKYGVQIKDPRQYLLLSRITKKMLGKEEETQVVCLIPELCYVTGLDDKARKDFGVMKDLDVHTKLSPEARDRALRAFISSVNSNEKATGILRDWGLSLAPEGLSLQGGRIENQEISLGGGYKFRTNDTCDWTREVVSNRVLTPVDIHNWAIFFTQQNKGVALNFVEVLTRVTHDLGIIVSKPRFMQLADDRTITFVNTVKMTINPELQIVVVISPSQREDRYSAVKVLCSIEKPIASQFVNAKTLSRPERVRSIVQKIALQMNAKLGGELWSVPIPLKSVMICGIDVYHDATKGGRSVAGFVASSNPAATRWYCRCSYQQPGQEMVDRLKICFMNSLEHYYKVNHTFPTTIIVFRDGVGDGQLETTARHEVVQLVKCLSFKPDYNPKLAFMVVSKRINTRIFLRERPGLKNPPPGTIVDHSITKKDIWDFFLVSQHVRQGTVAPTRFIVLRDGTMKPEHLQKLSYKMTHLYYNWTGTVRVPAPCMYAHKLAYHVGTVLHKEIAPELWDRPSFL